MPSGKINRSIRLDAKINKNLNKICVRHGDFTWHVERAISAYLKKMAVKRLRGEDKQDDGE